MARVNERRRTGKGRRIMRITDEHIATLENKEQYKRTNVYIYLEGNNNEYRYIVKCFKDGYKVDEQICDTDSDALSFSLEFIQ